MTRPRFPRQHRRGPKFARTADAALVDPHRLATVAAILAAPGVTRRDMGHGLTRLDAPGHPSVIAQAATLRAAEEARQDEMGGV